MALRHGVTIDLAPPQICDDLAHLEDRVDCPLARPRVRCEFFPAKKNDHAYTYTCPDRVCARVYNNTTIPCKSVRYRWTPGALDSRIVVRLIVGLRHWEPESPAVPCCRSPTVYPHPNLWPCYPRSALPPQAPRARQRWPAVMSRYKIMRTGGGRFVAIDKRY